MPTSAFAATAAALVAASSQPRLAAAQDGGAAASQVPPPTVAGTSLPEQAQPLPFEPPLPLCSVATLDIAYFLTERNNGSLVDLYVSNRVPLASLSGRLDDCGGGELSPVAASGGLLGELGFVAQTFDGNFAFANPENLVVPEIEAAGQGAAREYNLWTTFSFPAGTGIAQTCAQDPLGLMVFAVSAQDGAIGATQCQLPLSESAPSTDGGADGASQQDPSASAGHDHADPDQHPFPDLPLCSNATADIKYFFRPKAAHRAHSVTEMSMFVSSQTPVSQLRVQLDDCFGHFLPVKAVRLDEGLLIRSGLLPQADGAHVSFADRSGQNRTAMITEGIDGASPRPFDLWATFELVDPLPPGAYVCAQPPDFGDAEFTPTNATSCQCVEQASQKPNSTSVEGTPAQPDSGADANGSEPGEEKEPLCAGLCNLGGNAEYECYCDAQCLLTQDCCWDACETCGHCDEGNDGGGAAASDGEQAANTTDANPPATDGGHDHTDPTQHPTPDLPLCHNATANVSYQFRPKAAHRSHTGVGEVSLFVSNAVPVGEISLQLDDCLGHFVPVRSVRLDEGLLVRSGMLPQAVGTYVSFADRSGQNRSVAAMAEDHIADPRHFELWATFELVSPLPVGSFVCAQAPDFGDAQFRFGGLPVSGTNQCVESAPVEGPDAQPDANGTAAGGDGGGAGAAEGREPLCTGLCGAGNGVADCFCDTQCSFTSDCCWDACITCNVGCGAEVESPGGGTGGEAQPLDDLPGCSESTFPVSHLFRPKQQTAPTSRDHNVTEVSWYVANAAPVGAASVRIDDCFGETIPVVGVRLDEGLLVRSGMLPQTDSEGNIIFADRSGLNRTLPAQGDAEIKKKRDARQQDAIETPRSYDLWVTFELARPIEPGAVLCATPPDRGNATFQDSTGNVLSSSQCAEKAEGGATNSSGTPPAAPNATDEQPVVACANLCGVGSGTYNCFCDAACSLNNDCCPDACDTCGVGCPGDGEAPDQDLEEVQDEPDGAGNVTSNGTSPGGGSVGEPDTPAPTQPPSLPPQSDPLIELGLPSCQSSSYPVSYTFRPKQATGATTRDQNVTEVVLQVANSVNVTEMVIRLDDCQGNFIPINAVRLDDGLLVRSGLLPIQTPTSTVFTDRSGQNRSAAAQANGTTIPREYVTWAVFELATALSRRPHLRDAARSRLRELQEHEC